MDDNKGDRRDLTLDLLNQLRSFSPIGPDGKPTWSDEQLLELIEHVGLDVDPKPETIANLKTALRLYGVERKLPLAGREARLTGRVDAPRILLPPRLVYDGLLKRLLSPGAYRRYIVPHVADMHEEYFECLANSDESGARWAIIRGHLYVVPSWVWSLLGQLLARVLGRRI